ncbi:ficolin-2-like [Acanthaster planci]|uniref:Ficolin-2-like n=1 Tax=Acanthaster planci TaxID=133434 RepID=A0A8B7XKL9_ACAPL|nr:ficolin-2-like [Acanthaster planci]
MAPEPTEPAANCQEILDAGVNTSGVYTIQHDGKTMQVYCNMESDAGYMEYAEGFGDLTGEFWLGSEKLHDLTSTGRCELIVTLRAFDGQNATVCYEDFKIESVDERYKLNVGSFHTVAGNAGDSLHGDQKFSTKDRGDDGSGSRNYAAMFHGGWWYKKYNGNNINSNLNGLYHSSPNVNDYQGIQWVSYKRRDYSLKGCEMKMSCGPKKGCGSGGSGSKSGGSS